MKGPPPVINISRRLLSIGIASFLGAALLSSGLVFGAQTASAVTYPSSYERLWNDNCLAWERITTPNIPGDGIRGDCVYGNKSSKITVALVGDSHASHLFPAIERIAIARGWKLVVMVKVSCGFHNLTISNLHLGRTYTECTTWNKNVLARLVKIKPSLTLVLNSRFAIRSSVATTAKGKAVGYMMAKVPGKVAIIVDLPRKGQASATTASMGTIEKVAAAYSGDSVINLTKDTCSRWPCPNTVSGLTKFRDAEHFHAKFARNWLGAPDKILDKALDARL